MTVQRISASWKAAAKTKGFTLIEFLVASALGLIVLLAVGITYATTNRTKRASESRLSVQQDLRNVGEMITRDARMAGSFGCFNMGAGIDHSAPVYSISGNLKLDPADKTNGYGIYAKYPANLTDSAFKQSGFVPKGEALIFIYGLDPVSVSETYAIPANSIPALWNKAGGAVALSSCLNMVIDNVSAQPAVQVGSATSIFSTTHNQKDNIYLPHAMVSKVHTVAYVVGTIPLIDQNQSSLYRFVRQADGKWGNPELMAINIASMSVDTVYSSCSLASTKAEFSATPPPTAPDKRNSGLPSILEVRLDLNDRDETYGHVSQYLIRANIRGGNECRNVAEESS